MEKRIHIATLYNNCDRDQDTESIERQICEEVHGLIALRPLLLDELGGDRSAGEAHVGESDGCEAEYIECARVIARHRHSAADWD